MDAQVRLYKREVSTSSHETIQSGFFLKSDDPGNTAEVRSLAIR